MHGGGDAPARVNEQQWRNQIKLYEPDEGVYLAPRAPTNTWNLWHQPHIDKFFRRIIQNAILFENVNPNRVYILGYSAGGDGVYQLAPRMADSLAAAAAMAGHPNDASPMGLRNIGFTVHMGGKDSAYNRNKVALDWKKKLAVLREEDPGGYKHNVVIHEPFGHWMKRKDAVALGWMAEFFRNARPEKIVWRQSGVTNSEFYWLAVDPETARKDSVVVACLNGQELKIEKASGIDELIGQFNDQIVDLDQPIKVVFGDKVKGQRMVSRNANNIYESIDRRGDPELIYSARFKIFLGN